MKNFLLFLRSRKYQLAVYLMQISEIIKTSQKGSEPILPESIKYNPNFRVRRPIPVIRSKRKKYDPLRTYRFHTTLYQNTGKTITDRIGISYCASTPTLSRGMLFDLYLRHGHSVVRIRRCPADTVRSTLRVILAHTTLMADYLTIALLSDRVKDIASVLNTLFSSHDTVCEISTKLPMMSVMEGLLRMPTLLHAFFPPLMITLDFSYDFRQIFMSFLHCFEKCLSLSQISLEKNRTEVE